MTAARLRRIGTKNALVDPGAVIAVYESHKPAGVAVILAGGIRLTVVEAADLGRDVTSDDVAKVHNQLTARPT